MDFVNDQSRVKPQVPAYVMEKGIEWSDREIIFISLIFNLAREGGWNTVYYMHAKDAGRILKGYGSRPVVYDNLREVFDIGILNDYTIMIRPHKQEKYHQHLPLIWRGEPVTITDGPALLMWYYLVGRLSCGEVLGEPSTPVDGKALVWKSTEEGKVLSRILENQIEWPDINGRRKMHDRRTV